MSDLVQNPPSQNPFAQSPKLFIATALITAITTIGVAVIGILPQLKSKDQTIETLNTRIDQLQKGLNVTNGSTNDNSGKPDKTLTFKGTVLDLNGNRPLQSVDVLLIRDGKFPLSDQTDDSGNFTIDHVPDGHYSIMVRDGQTGQSGKAILPEDQNEVIARGYKIKYRIR